MNEFNRIRGKYDVDAMKRTKEIVLKHLHNNGTPSTQEVEDLILELEVHQIELEMQNWELQQAKKDLEALRSRYADLYLTAPAGLLAMDEKGIMTELNLAAALLLNKDRSELIGRPFLDFVAEADRPAYLLHLKRCAESAGEAMVDLHVESEPEPEKAVRLRSLTLAQTAGRSAAYSSSILELRDAAQASQALCDETEKYFTLFKESQDGIVLIEAETGVICDGNPEFEKQSGLKLADLKGLKIWDVQPVAQSEFAKKLFRDACRLGCGSTVVFDLLKTDERKLPLEFICKEISIGRRRYIQCQSRDITEKVQEEELARQAREQLWQSQKMDALSRLASGVAHALNNLLTSVLGYSRLASDELPEGHPVRAYTEAIIESGDRAVGLTRQLTAIGAGRPGALHPLDLNIMVRRMDKLLRRTLGAEIELVTLLGEDVSCIRADEPAIEQIILNLAINAREAMPQGGTLTLQTSRVELATVDCPCHSAIKPGTYTTISVRDTGCGIRKDIRDLIFEPFYTTKQQHSGLGLSLLYGIVHQCGGHIVVGDGLEVGAELRIYFPFCKDKPSAAATKNENVLARGNETVLVVEDEDRVRMLAVHCLTSLGYQVLKASNGVDALMQVMQMDKPVDLIFTDMSMPQMGGRMLVEKLRKIRGDFKVLFTTGYMQDSLVGSNNGFNAPVLLKPYTFSSLAQKIRSVLDAS
ncbi:MAG TPA: hypothetical protein DCZ95_04390 [Verrucomicrobia bacterium]|nr:MAG: hypothetical protein A2X46_07650 [Lentisphaerae bacterium GWF2_57_35]HBA83315.1 hypothetical protein [Verrucomicrobiota bacterium]